MSSQAPEEIRKAIELLIRVRSEFLQKWHWFDYHAKLGTPFIVSIALACMDLERISPDAPERMFRELAKIRGRENYMPHYNQILQKLAEILVMRYVVLMPWPEGTRFEIEAVAPTSDKRVDLAAFLPDGAVFGFEVKAPAELDHAERRGQSDFQLPSRTPDGTMNSFKPTERIVLPRDNTLRDFLRGANQKFVGFKAVGNFTGILVIVWDDFVYESIGPLVNDRNGLLTPASYSRAGDEPETFRNLDGVIILRHLTYFIEAAAERGLPDNRIHAMHVGGKGALPNVFIPVPRGATIPEYIAEGFFAWPLDSDVLKNVPDYWANELILWTRF